MQEKDVSSWLNQCRRSGWDGGPSLNAHNSNNENLLCWAIRDKPEHVDLALYYGGYSLSAGKNFLIQAALYRPQLLSMLINKHPEYVRPTIDQFITDLGHFYSNVSRGPENSQEFVGSPQKIQIKAESNQYVLRNLLLGGIDPNIDRSSKSAYPLLFDLLAYNAPLSTIRLFVEHGANPHAVTFDGRTSLMEASRHPDALRYLLDLGVDTLASDENGFTALMFAIVGDNWDCVQMLLDVSDLSATQKEGLTARELAAKHQPEIYKKLQAKLSKDDLDQSLKDIPSQPPAPKKM